MEEKSIPIESKESIQYQVKELSNYVELHSKDKDFLMNVSEQFSDFSDKYPTLFKQITYKECDFKQLEFMLHKLENVRLGSISQHDASVQIGQLLVDKYVKPELDKKDL